MEAKVVDSTFKERARGQHYGLTIGCLGLLSGTVCILKGHDWAGAVVGGGAVVSLVTAFVYGRSMESKHRPDQ